MRAFASSSYRLGNARLEVRLAYSGFLVLTLIGMATMAAFQLHHIGATPGRVAAHYRGGEVAGQMTFAKTVRELVEVTHFHAFIFAVVYLVLAHLFIATAVSQGTKHGLIVLGFVGLFADLLAPWLICFVAAGFAYLQLFAWSAEWVSFGAFIFIPLREMWFGNDADVALE